MIDIKVLLAIAESLCGGIELAKTEAAERVDSLLAIRSKAERDLRSGVCPDCGYCGGCHDEECINHP